MTSSIRALLVATALLCPVASRAQATGSGITVAAAVAGDAVAGQDLAFDIVLDIPTGIHVYSEDSHFFKLSDAAVSGLGAARVTLPPRQSIRDLLSDDPLAKTQVFGGRTLIRVTRPVTGKAGEAWRYSGQLDYQGCTETTCFPPTAATWDLTGTVTGSADGATASSPAATAAGDSAQRAGSGWDGGLLGGVLAAFVAGLLLSLTPCVYPMIGITVAVIGGRGNSRGRTLWLTFIYVLGLALVYAIAGIIVAKVGDEASALFRSPLVLLPIGVVFLVMGLSMFDLFELQTPSALVTRLKALGGTDSAMGVFVMGALSAFVVGPCVSGPLLSLILYVASTGAVVKGFLLFFALAWGMGAILFLAGSASSLLPRAGGWMVAVKHLLGMVMIWAAFYFTRPVIGETAYLAGTLTCLGVTLGVLGLFRIPAAEGPRLGPWLRLATAAVILFLGQLALVKQLERDTGTGQAVTERAVVDLAAELAKGKPVLLDFWAPWCAICKEIERTVVNTPEIQAALQPYNFVKVNYDTNPELVRRFGLVGPPAYIFLDAAGKAPEPVIVTGEELRRRLLNAEHRTLNIER